VHTGSFWSEFFVVKSKPKTVEEVLNKAQDKDKQVAYKLRLLVRSVVPKAAEIVRRGRITYTLNEKDFAAIRLTQRHVDLLFFGGERLSSSLLKGKGSIKDPRHVQVMNMKNFDQAEVTRLLKDAAAIV
jgi:hypothetical protein